MQNMIINFFGDFVTKGSADYRLDQKLTSLLRSADYNAVNFEAPIQQGLHIKPQSKSGPAINQTPEGATWLKKHGFNLFPLANNHIFDYGEVGFKHTLKALTDNSTFIVGCGNFDTAFAPVWLEKSGIRIAVFSLTELQFGVLHDEWTQKDSIGCAWINHACVEDNIRIAKNTADYVIIVAHAGLEGLNVPLPEWRSRYFKLIDCGADVIIGHHPHITQGVDFYHNSPIFYSLGNFAFECPGTPPSWSNGFCIQLSFSKKNFDYRVFGTSFHSSNKTISLRKQSEVDSEMQELNSLLKPTHYLPYIQEACCKWLPGYYNLFSMGGVIHPDKYLFKSILRWLLGRCNKLHLLNNLQCESHRWTICRALRQKK